MNDKCPLSKEIWEKFVSGSLEKVESYDLLAHLQTECEHCDSFLSGLSPESLRNSLTWAVENALANTPGELDGLERELIFNRVMAEIQAVPAQSPNRFKPLFGVLAATLIVLITGIIIKPDIQEEYNGRKGETLVKPSITLQVAVLKGGAGNVPVRGIPGEKYSENDTLFFRYELATEGYVYLVRVHEGATDLIDPQNISNSIKQQKGLYEFRDGQNVMGYSLSKLHGKQMFLIITSAKPFKSRANLDEMVDDFLSGRLPKQNDYLAVDGFPVILEKD